jgi:RiboL-PSP-HEPN
LIEAGALPTRKYARLARRIADLDRRFLPRLSPTGSYSAREYDRVRAYVVLVHAEIEAFVEELASDVLASSHKRWTTTKRSGRCIAALMMYNDRRVLLPTALSKQKRDQTFDEMIRSAITAHGRMIAKENHGIKEANLLRVLLPIGVFESDFDPIWLGTISSFGSSRGVVAHTSASQVQTPPDPATTRAQVNDILVGLMDLEATVRVLLRA